MYDVPRSTRSPRVAALELFRNLLLVANKVTNVMFSVVSVSHWCDWLRKSMTIVT